MEYNNQISEQSQEHDALLFTPPKCSKTKKARKWREIEEVKARQQLSKELQELELY